MDKEQAVGEDYHHHMQIPWQDFVEDDNVTPAKEAPLVEPVSYTHLDVYKRQA